MGRKRGRTHQSEGLSGCGLSVGKQDRIVTAEITRFLATLLYTGGSGDEFVEVEFWRGSAGGFCILGVEFDGLGA